MKDDDRTRVQASPYVLNDGADLNAWLIVLSGGSAGRMFRVDMDEQSLGRSNAASIRLDDEGISRIHAVLKRTPDGTIQVTDMDSTNGVFVNGEKVRERVLQDGDRLLLGPVTFLKFSYQSAIEERFQQQLYESATCDPLTRVFNRRYFVQQIARECSHAARHGSPLSLMMIDVDYFKRINDTHGHLAGDMVLERMAAVIGDSTREEDVLCRIGGEEFAIILRDTGLRSAHVFGERIRTLVEQSEFRFDEGTLSVTVSIGLAALDRHAHQTPKDLLAETDGFLYRAKEQGRNQVASRLNK